MEICLPLGREGIKTKTEKCCKNKAKKGETGKLRLSAEVKSSDLKIQLNVSISGWRSFGRRVADSVGILHVKWTSWECVAKKSNKCSEGGRSNIEIKSE